MHSLIYLFARNIKGNYREDIWFSNHVGFKLEIKNRKTVGKSVNTRRLNNMKLSMLIKKRSVEMQIVRKLMQNEMTTYPNVWVAARAS